MGGQCLMARSQQSALAKAHQDTRSCTFALFLQRQIWNPIHSQRMTPLRGDRDKIDNLLPLKLDRISCSTPDSSVMPISRVNLRKPQCSLRKSGVWGSVYVGPSGLRGPGKTFLRLYRDLGSRKPRASCITGGSITTLKHALTSGLELRPKSPHQI